MTDILLNLMMDGILKETFRPVYYNYPTYKISETDIFFKEGQGFYKLQDWSHPYTEIVFSTPIHLSLDELFKSLPKHLQIKLLFRLTEIQQLFVYD